MSANCIFYLEFFLYTETIIIFDCNPCSNVVCSSITKYIPINRELSCCIVKCDTWRRFNIGTESRISHRSICLTPLWRSVWSYLEYFRRSYLIISTICIKHSRTLDSEIWRVPFKIIGEWIQPILINVIQLWILLSRTISLDSHYKGLRYSVFWLRCNSQSESLSIHCCVRYLV